MKDLTIDHLFRHQYGKMVSILTRIFGFHHLQTIEDAVQDTFIKAMRTWPNEMPDNPEAWLTQAAKNRIIDVFRSINSEKARSSMISNPLYDMPIDELFLNNEIEDSQLRMIFSACHPNLEPKDQIAFALKTISGFSTKEIAAALLTKEETIKKRLQRARKRIIEESMAFEIPSGPELPPRIDRVLEVIYVIFNEGFHSAKKDKIVRKDLCGEALRLCKLLLSKVALRRSKVYALMALFCFHSARLESKVDENNELITIDKQDRSQWYFPLVAMGDSAMAKAVEHAETYSSYHYEAAIASEHLCAKTFELTPWNNIAHWYEQLIQIQPNVQNHLNLSICYLKLNKLSESKTHLNKIDSNKLGHKAYLFDATMAEFYHLSGKIDEALKYIDKALDELEPGSEFRFLSNKKKTYAKGLTENQDGDS